LREVYPATAPPGRLYHDAPVWKQAFIGGSFLQVVEAIEGWPVFLVGPPHLAKLADVLPLGDCRPIRIDEFRATEDRQAI
jgi:hypothetical protein